MTRQLRAVRTRQALVNAAATEFDRSGYAGAALNRVCRAAGTTMGALTFHFSTKDELAAAVQAMGQSVTRAALAALPSGPAPALHRAIDATLELARLLEEEPAVRSAARLSRERPAGDLAWTESWVTAVQDLFCQAYREGQLHAAVRPEDLAMLSRFLILGAEYRARAASGQSDGEPREAGAAEEIRQMWDIIQRGICGTSSLAPS
ncbi:MULTISPECIES: TetR/AcrR family transcriptional regulator [unclassified Streptomyces]|uniref:TetR family transcriptional regulator n=1 Tax=unclassified Streptomyces TaxID=2593676 RepID=UPI0004C38452